MREIGSAASWSLSVTGDPRPFELVVRDALRLDTADVVTSPPPLVPYPDDHSGLLSSAALGRMAEQWSGWWRERVTDRLSDSSALAARPDLEHACTLLEPLAHQWSRREPPRELDTGALTALDCEQIAAGVAAGHGVALASVRGAILAYGVEGPWRRVAAPGVLLCSAVDLQTEPDAVVREVFVSSVRDHA